MIAVFYLVFGARPGGGGVDRSSIVIARRQSGSTDGSAEHGRAELDRRCRRKFGARHCGMDDRSLPGSRVKRMARIPMYRTAPSRLAFGAEGRQPPASE